MKEQENNLSEEREMLYLVIQTITCEEMFEDAVMKMLWWRCCDEDAMKKMLWRRCYEEDAMMKMLWWRCYEEDAVMKMLWRRCYEDDAMMKMLWRRCYYEDAIKMLLYVKHIIYTYYVYNALESMNHSMMFKQQTE